MTRRLLGEMKKRQMEYIGNVLRKKEMEYLLLMGKIDGKKSRGRPRQMYFQSVAQELGISFTGLIHAVNDCAKWMTMAANIHNWHGTQ